MAQVPLQGKVVGSQLAREHEGGQLGLGICVGAPTGFSGKLWLGQGSAFQVMVGTDPGRLNEIGASADFVMEVRPIIVEGNQRSLPIHLGLGVKGSADLTVPGTLYLLGPRFPVGVSLLFADLPIDLQLEVAPTLFVAEQPGWAIDGDIAIRYYF